MSRTASPRVYLAGPAVFRTNAIAFGRAMTAACTQHGLEGVFPLDASLDLEGLPSREQARRIALANEALIRSCDALLADMTPFRGVSMDPGTAYEMGYARALGLPMIGYTASALDLADRARTFRLVPPLPYDGDRTDMTIEDFGLPDNLMMAIAVEDSGGLIVLPPPHTPQDQALAAAFQAALGHLARLLQA